MLNREGYVFADHVEPGVFVIEPRQIKLPQWIGGFSGGISFFDNQDIDKRIRILSEENSSDESESGAVFRILLEEVSSSQYEWKIEGDMAQEGLPEGKVVIRLTDADYLFEDGTTEASLPLKVVFCPENNDDNAWNRMKNLVNRTFWTEALIKGEEYPFTTADFDEFEFAQYIHQHLTGDDSQDAFMKAITSVNDMGSAFRQLMKYYEKQMTGAEDENGPKKDADCARTIMDRIEMALELSGKDNATVIVADILGNHLPMTTPASLAALTLLHENTATINTTQ